MPGRMVSTWFVAVILMLTALASCTGDTGPAGPEGPQGPTGPPGPEGPTGPAGVEVFAATLSGQNEVPPNDSEGTGTAVLTVVGGQLLFRVEVGNIENVTRAHIHGPAGSDENAGILVSLYEPPAGTDPLNFPETSTLAQGVAPAPAGISFDDLVELLRSGNAYVNVHTTTYPPGELRGQVQLQP